MQLLTPACLVADPHNRYYLLPDDGLGMHSNCYGAAVIVLVVQCVAQVATVQAACSGVPLEFLAVGQHYLQVETYYENGTAACFDQKMNVV